MSTLLVLDTVMRLLAIGQLLLIALVLALAPAPAGRRFTLVLLLVSVIAYLATASPFLQARGHALQAPLLFAAQFAPLLLWLSAHLLFDRPVPREAAIAAGSVVSICGAIFVFSDLSMRESPLWAVLLQHLLSLALLMHAIAFALRDRDNDLIERRRRFRIGFVLVVGVAALAVVLTEILYGFAPVDEPLVVVQSGTTLLAVLGFGAVMLAGDTELLFDARPAAPPPPLSPSEHVLNEKLEAFVGEGGYRAPGLTIGALAARLGVPEHRLRNLINRRLGYRNFSDFLNRHRIAEARALLADPEHVDLPVLTIAMDLGYGSLAPFNRAFREATAQTPSDFRRAAILGS